MKNRVLHVALLSLLPAALLAGCGGDEPAPADANASAANVQLSPPKAETTALDADHLAKAQKMINAGLRFLLSQREADGGWSFGGGVHKAALTALTVKCLLQHPDFDRTSPQVKQALDILGNHQQPDGAIYDPQQGRPAYTTAIAMMTLLATEDPRYDGSIRKASQYLKGIQVQPGQESPDGEPVAADDPNIGGVGYGRSKKPNLSVLQFVVEAWHEQGLDANDEAMQRAVGFLTHLQNRSESNPMAFAKAGDNDGGFVYEMNASKAGPGLGGTGLRSYGSMTYAGFKSMLYAGVARDDPRVQAAYMWIRRHWRLDSNPNYPQKRSQEGLYYYYQVFAKALRAWGQDEIPDGKDSSIKRNWRHELIDALAERAQPDGSWANAADRWNEGSPALVTCYCVLALQEALKK